MAHAQDNPMQDQSPNTRSVIAEVASDPLVEKLLSWGLAITAHVALVLLAVFVTWTIGATIVDPRGPVTLNPPQDQPRLTPTNTPDKDDASDPWHRSISKEATATDEPINVIGVVGPTGGFWDGLVKRTESQQPNALESSRFGGDIFKLPTSDKANRVVFLVDASGSLIDSLPIVLRDLKNTLRTLDPRQRFTVILYQTDRVFELPPQGMKRATYENTQDAVNWLSSETIVPRGQTNPLLALQRALKYQPDLLFILSDNITGRGRHEVDQARLLAEIDRLNVARTQINTIQFLYPDPLTRHGGKATLELIAQRSGGTYRFIQARELELE